jgi:hypothetical protein
MGTTKLDMILNMLVTAGKLTPEEINNWVNGIEISKRRWVELGRDNKWNMPISEDTKAKMRISKLNKPSINKGRVWVFNSELKETRLIKRVDIDLMVSAGWELGRLTFDV